MTLTDALIDFAVESITKLLHRPDRDDGSTLVNFVMQDMFHCHVWWEPCNTTGWRPGKALTPDLKKWVEETVFSAFGVALRQMKRKDLIEVEDDEKVLRVVPTDSMKEMLVSNGGNGLELPLSAPIIKGPMGLGLRKEALSPRVYRLIHPDYLPMVEVWGQKLLGSYDNSYSEEFIKRQMELWNRMILRIDPEVNYSQLYYCGKYGTDSRGRQKDHIPTLSEFGAKFARGLVCQAEGEPLTEAGKREVGWTIAVLMGWYWGFHWTPSALCRRGWWLREHLRNMAKSLGQTLRQTVNRFVGYDPNNKKTFSLAEKACHLYFLCSEEEGYWSLLVERDTKTSGITLFAWLSGDELLLETCGYNPRTQFKSDAYRAGSHLSLKMQRGGKYKLTGCEISRDVLKYILMPYVYGKQLSSAELVKAWPLLNKYYTPLTQFRRWAMEVGRNWEVGRKFRFLLGPRKPRFKSIWTGESKEIRVSDGDHSHKVPVVLKYDVDLEALGRFFPSSLLHGFDAAVANYICNKFVDRGWEIHSIHDAWLVHPNHAGQLRRVFAEALRVLRKSVLRIWFGNFKGCHGWDQYKQWQDPLKNKNFNPEVVLR